MSVWLCILVFGLPFVLLWGLSVCDWVPCVALSLSLKVLWWVFLLSVCLAVGVKVQVSVHTQISSFWRCLLRFVKSQFVLLPHLVASIGDLLCNLVCFCTLVHCCRAVCCKSRCLFVPWCISLEHFCSTYIFVQLWTVSRSCGEAHTWLILPVVICLSQRLSHACLSISFYTAKLRMAH